MSDLYERAQAVAINAMGLNTRVALAVMQQFQLNLVTTAIESFVGEETEAGRARIAQLEAQVRELERELELKTAEASTNGNWAVELKAERDEARQRLATLEADYKYHLDRRIEVEQERDAVKEECEALSEELAASEAGAAAKHSALEWALHDQEGRYDEAGQDADSPMHEAMRAALESAAGTQLLAELRELQAERTRTTSLQTALAAAVEALKDAKPMQTHETVVVGGVRSCWEKCRPCASDRALTLAAPLLPDGGKGGGNG